MNQSRRRHKPDYWLVLLASAMLSIGLVVVYSISPGVSALRGVSENYFISKQLIAIALGVTAFIVLSKVPYTKWRDFVLPLCVISLAASLAVLVFGEEVNGAKRWIQFGGMSFQPAEMVKFTLMIAAADLLARAKSQNTLDSFDKTIKPLGIALGLIAVIIGILQSDLGSTVVMASMLIAMMFVAGVPLERMLKIGLVIAVGAALLILPSSYRRDRVMTFLNPAADCQNEGYQSCQALIAVGSGGMFGLGLARSVQAYGYLPEATNDSIFAIYAEKFGFIGVALLLTIYIVFFSRILRIIERAPDDFSRLMMVGMLVWFSVQAAINIGAMLGLLPLKGITLPFISYGGTSLLFVTGALGIAFQVSRYSSLTNQVKSGEANEDYAYRRGQRRPHYAAVSRRS